MAASLRRALALLLGLSIAACGNSGRDHEADTGRVVAGDMHRQMPPLSEVRADPDSADGARADSAVGASINSARTLESAAKEIIAFLNGEADFEKISVADTVVLYLSPEGGGTRATFTRESLRNPSKWVIHSGRWSYSFVPPRTLRKLTAKAGRHFNCLEYPLASRFPHLARLPHVGVKLEGDTLTSCLATWNATFVFDSIARPPRLVAAVYDQWEW